MNVVYDEETFQQEIRNSMPNTVLKLSNFSFSYGANRILSDINFSVEEGEYLCIIGPNGAGKSTLLKCLTRIAKGGQGQIQLLGKDINEYPQKHLGRIIGYVPQSTEHTFPFTVYEFISMGRYPYLNAFSKVTQNDIDIIDNVIQLAGLSSLLERDLHTLSGGEKQCVYIAASLAQEPKILLLDEPKNHLDPKHCQDVQQTLSEISARLGITTIHVTHDLNHIAHWSNKVIALKNGTILLRGKPQEIVAPANLKLIFDTDFHAFKNPTTDNPIIVPFV